MPPVHSKTGSAAPSGGGDSELALDRRWHLAQTEHEVNLSELEFALMRVERAFERWESECFAASSGMVLSGGENALLHVVRLHDRAKPLKDLVRLTNRDDIPNLQYALRKLIKLGLVRQSGARSNAVYAVTELGAQVTDRYASIRAQLLTEFTGSVTGFDQQLRQSTQTLNLLSGIYDQAARIVATHQRIS